MLVPMAKVEIIGPKSRLQEVLTSLHDYGSLHIQDISGRIHYGSVDLDRMQLPDDQMAAQTRLEGLVEELDGLLRHLKDVDPAEGPARRKREYARLDHLGDAELFDHAETLVTGVSDEIARLVRERSMAEDEIAMLGRYEPVLRKIQPLAGRIVRIASFESVALLMESRYRAALDAFREQLDEITSRRCDLVSMDVDDETMAVIIMFDSACAEAVRRFLDMENLQQVQLPSDLKDVPYDEAYERITDRVGELTARISEISGRLQALSLQWFDGLEATRWELTDRLEEFRAVSKFGQTKYAFVMTGWMPVDEVKWVRKGLTRSFSGEVILVQMPMTDADAEDVPIEMRNARILRPFQSLVTMMGTPVYGSVDPTWMIAFFYPLFFGMIVGDVGYGLIMLALVVWLRLKFRGKQEIQLATSVLGPATTMVVVFGFIYGEFFGDIMSHYLGWIRNVHIGSVSLPFHRIELMQQFMIIAVTIGFLQILFGLATGIVNGVRTKHRRHVLEKAGMLGVLVGLPLLLGVSAIPLLSDQPVSLGLRILAVAMIGAGLVFAFIGGSVIGIIESVLQFSNVASYIRIMAVGLAGAIFADAVNEMVATMGNVVVGVMIGLLLHALNLLIAAFSPTIHALRLNFLEFFGKFYEAGKQRYRPFQKAGSEESTW